MTGEEGSPSLPKKDRSRRRLRRRLLFTAYVLSATVLLLALLELIASFYTTLPTAQFIKDARLSHTWPPGSKHVHDQWIKDNPEFPEPYVHHYNSQCWIETYDVTREKPLSTWRIFYVGDSFTEGCVPMDESVASRVEDALDGRYGGQGYDFEVINTGTSSYSTILYYILIRYFINGYSPDVIVVDVDMTDNFDDWKYKQRMIADAEGNPFAVPAVRLYGSLYVDTLEGAIQADLLSRARLFLYQHSHLFNLILKLRKRPSRVYERMSKAREIDAGREPFFPRWAWCRHEWDEETERHVRFSMDILGRIADFCNARGIRLLLTGVPHYQQFATDSAGRTKWSVRPHREIERVARAKGVAYLDSWKCLRSHVAGTPQERYYYRHDIHFNPRGNRLWAEAHIRAFLDPANGLLPPGVH